MRTTMNADANHDPTAELAPASPLKKRYEKPRLTELGDVRELTRGTTGSHSEKGGHPHP
jgi:hypothetical protein